MSGPAAKQSPTESPSLGRYQHWRRMVIGGLLLLLIALLLFVDTSQPEIEHEEIEMWGMMLMLIGIFGRLWCTLYIGGHKSAQIIDTGPYSIMRNPLYFFSAIAAAGVGMQVGSWTLGLLFAVLCWAAFMIVIRREERFLADVFGATYQSYMQRVPRFFPNPMLYKDQEEVVFRPDRLKQTLFDGLFFFAAVPIFELIEKGQQSGIIPVLLHLP